MDMIHAAVMGYGTIGSGAVSYTHLLALLLNEIHNKFFKNVTQTITYLPHFISMIDVCGMLTDFSLSTGCLLYTSGFSVVGNIKFCD